MKVFNLVIMFTIHVNYLLLLLSLFASVCSYPSTPLNERNQEISWEAWLLVDDQNQNRQAGDGQIPKRRITPKSVFVAPTFSPKDLPPCPEGYSSDPMGRCIKIIKIDEDKHLDFLVNKLNEKFGSYLDYETSIEIEDSNSEPIRLEIPLGSDYEEDYSNDTPQDELKMAIIVTPTAKESDSTKVDANSKLGKRDDTISEDMYEEELKKLLKLTTTTTTTTKYDYTTLKENTEQTTVDQSSDDDQSMSTLQSVDAEETTTVQTTEELPTTTLATTTDASEEETTTLKKYFESMIQTDENIDDTTVSDPTTTLEVTTEVSTTTTEFEEINTTPKVTTTTPKITTYHPLATTYHPFFDLNMMGSNSRTKNLVKFPDEEPTMARSHPDGNYVKFPDVDSKYQQESLVHHTRDIDEHTGNFFNEIVTPQPSHRVHEIVLPPKGMVKGYYSGFNHNFKNSGGFYPKFFPSKEETENSEKPQQHHYRFHDPVITEKHPLKKSKEKHGNLFLLPPKWSPEEPHKPIVLRFSRKHFNFDISKFKNSEFYRSLPMDDLTYVFGYKNGQTSRR